MNEKELSYIETLGEAGVLMAIAKGEFGGRGATMLFEAEAWLRAKAVLRSKADSDKRDAREEQTLSIAAQARSEARRANTIAIIAMVLSTIIAASGIIIGVIFSRP